MQLSSIHSMFCKILQFCCNMKIFLLIFFRYGSGSFSLSDIIGGVTVSFNTEFILQQVSG